MVLGLLWCNLSFAKTINIENKILLNVPENFNYIKIEEDEVADYYEEFFSSLGEDTAFYYIGTDDSIEFANALINDQDKVLEPIMKKMEKKNFSTEKTMINFFSKEIKKLMKKNKYQGVIWVLVSEENLIATGVNDKTGFFEDKKVKWKNIIGVFQPHRFSRTKNLYNEFIKALKKFDVLYILDIYPAGEKSIKDINSQNFVKDLKKKNPQVYYLKKNANIYKIFSSYYNEKNLIIFMGAGSITHEAHKIVKENHEFRKF